MAKVRGSQVAGLMTMPAQVAQMGAPPSWGAYVKVRDVAESTAAAARLAAKVLMPATPMGPGTFSVIQRGSAHAQRCHAPPAPPRVGETLKRGAPA
jgi:hypothetical protein